MRFTSATPICSSYKRTLLLLATAVLSGCCFGNPDCFVSPNRTEHYQLQETRTRLKAFCSQLEDCQPCKLQVIGHGAASFRHYPMDVSWSGLPVSNNKTWHSTSLAKNVTHLIDAAFSDGFIDAVEIDAQLPSSCHPLCEGVDKTDCAFIMHNEPKWSRLTEKRSPEAFSYMRKNTVKAVLNHFVDRQYPAQGKHLYLEIKGSRECAHADNRSTECTAAGTRIAGIIKSVFENRQLQPTEQNWLTVTSFSASALTAVHDELAKHHLQEGIDYALIAGYDRPLLGIKARLAQCKGPVPQFDKDMQKFVVTTPWLNQVWFSTKGISKPEEVFALLVQQRSEFFAKNPEMKHHDLTFNVSYYDRKKEAFKKAMQDFSLPLASVMIDVDD